MSEQVDDKLDAFTSETDKKNRMLVLFKYASVASLLDSKNCYGLTEGLNNLTYLVYKNKIKEEPFLFIYDDDGEILSLNFSNQIAQTDSAILSVKIIWEIVTSSKFEPPSFDLLKNVLAQFKDLLKIKRFFLDIYNENYIESVNLAFECYKVEKQKIGN